MPACRFGQTDDAVEIAAFNELTRKAILAQWRPALSRLVSRDLISGEDVEAATQAGFIPLLSLDLEKDIADALVEEMKAGRKASRSLSRPPSRASPAGSRNATGAARPGRSSTGG